MIKASVQALKEELDGAHKVVILGLGNELCYGDHPGLLAAREIERLDSSKKYQVFLTGTTPENFTGAIRKSSPSHVVFLDAADMGKDPGTVEIIDESELDNVSLSTHNIPLSVLSNYLTQDINCKVIVVGIQPATTSSNQGDVIRETIRELALLLCQD